MKITRVAGFTGFERNIEFGTDFQDYFAYIEFNVSTESVKILRIDAWYYDEDDNMMVVQIDEKTKLQLENWLTDLVDWDEVELSERDFILQLNNERI